MTMTTDPKDPNCDADAVLRRIANELKAWCDARPLPDGVPPPDVDWKAECEKARAELAASEAQCNGLVKRVVELEGDCGKAMRQLNLVRADRDRLDHLNAEHARRIDAVLAAAKGGQA
jgi:hypothetical protein